MLRSGTTLLCQLLGNVDGCLALGELRHCWGVLAANTPCACGRPVRECPVWSAAVREAVGPGADPAFYEHSYALANTVLRPGLALEAARRHASPRVAEYRDLMVRLMRALAGVTGASYVVDASKSATGALLWASSRLPVHLVQIYRPPAAVAYSEARRVVWPDEVARYAPPSRTITKSALRWNAFNVSVSAVSRCADSYTLVRYDDLVSDPAGTLQEIVGKLPGFEDLVIDEVATSDRGHLVSGNPSFFERPVIREPDERWKRELTPREKALITAVTSPVSAVLDTRRRRLAAHRGGS
jgi:hypothetical protein